MNSSQVGDALLRRIAIREKSRAQVNFLRLLATHPLGDSLILYGSAALHGVHLHKRFPEDLDFLAPPDIAATFRTDFARYGLPMELASTPSGDLVPAYFEQGTVYERVVVGIDVQERTPDKLLSGGNLTALPDCEQRTFRGLSGTVPVRVVPFAPMVADKVDCVSERGEPTDYVDLFLALQMFPEVLPSVLLLLQTAAKTGIRPHWISESARAGLDAVAQTWTESVSQTMLSVPDYTTVRATLLPLFDLWDEVFL